MMRVVRWIFWQPVPICATFELCGEPIVFPTNAYQGDYVKDIAKPIKNSMAIA